MRNVLERRLVPRGLCGSSELTREILNSGEERAKLTVHENIGMNNLGSKEVINFLSPVSIYNLNSELQPNRFASFHLAADNEREAKVRTMAIYMPLWGPDVVELGG
jgi:hypothetical protein